MGAAGAHSCCLWGGVLGPVLSARRRAPLSPPRGLAAAGPVSAAAVAAVAFGLPILAVPLLCQPAQPARVQGGSRSRLGVLGKERELSWEQTGKEPVLR